MFEEYSLNNKPNSKPLLNELERKYSKLSSAVDDEEENENNE